MALLSGSGAQQPLGSFAAINAVEIQALRLQPGDVLKVVVPEQGGVWQAQRFLRELLDNNGHDRVALLVHAVGVTVEVMTDEQLAAAGVRRLTWRDKPPMI